MSDHEFPCPECDGEGELVCRCCGSEIDCESCDGTGFDPDLIDIRAWVAAERAFPSPSWDWERDGKTVGRQGPDGRTLAYADFLRNEESPDVS